MLEVEPPAVLAAVLDDEAAEEPRRRAVRERESSPTPSAGRPSTSSPRSRRSNATG